MLGLTQPSSIINRVFADDGGDCSCPANGTIGDYVWHDLFHDQNHKVDGIQDPDEPGIPGVIVELYNDMGELYGTTTTDADGYYLFTDLPDAVYTVKIADSNFESGGVLEGWYASPQHEGFDESVDSDGDPDTHEAFAMFEEDYEQLDIDFGFYTTGVSLEKTGPDSVVAGDEITYHFRLENTGDVVLHGGAHVYDPLIEPDGDHEIWSGVVYPGEVYEFDRTYTTSEDDCGDLVNTATAVGHPLDPYGCYLDDVTDEDSWTTQVLCGAASVGDLVWHDANANGLQDQNETGISGATVKLYRDADGDGVAEPDGDDGAPVATQTTDANGNYLFDDLAPDAYFLVFDTPTGYDASSPSNIGGDDSVDSDPVSGVTGVLNLAVGDADMSQDAGFYKFASVGDYVWWDVDEDGVQDADEPGIQDVTVTLKDSQGNVVGTIQTDTNGNYEFNDLIPGSYTVSFSLPSNWSFTAQDNSGDEATDSDADAATGDAGVNLASGENNNNIDAGMTIDASYALSKENTTVASEIAPGDPVSFTITITNTGDVWLTTIPVQDSYDNEYLTYVDATPASDDNNDDGVIDWSDITASTGEDLAPGESVSIIVNFTAKATTEGLSGNETTNTATTHDVIADPDSATGPTAAALVQSNSSAAPVNIVNPVGLTLESAFAHATSHAILLHWRTLDESNIIGFNLVLYNHNKTRIVTSNFIFAQHSGADRGSSYNFLDVDPSIQGKYVLEIIHLDGSTERKGFCLSKPQPISD